MDLRGAATELRCNILGQSLGIAAGHIDIEIFICFQLVEHIVDRDLDPAVFLIDDFSGELNFVNEQVELLSCCPSTNCSTYSQSVMGLRYL